MKIMIVISNAEMGGAQKVSINLAKWIKKNTKSSVHIVALTKANRHAYDMGETQFTVLNAGHISRQLHYMIKKDKIDIILTMGVPLSIYTVPACMGTGVKHIISERNDPAHFAGKTTTKIISRLLMRTASGFVFQTKEAQQYYGGFVSKRSRIIPNPLFNVEAMPKEPFQGKREKRIVSVGRLNKQKNQEMLIEVYLEIIKSYPEYDLIIWGEGPERENLEKLIKRLNLENKVKLPGTTNRILEEIYHDSMFVMTSDFEGMPNALMEAMAMGVPCISTDCPCGGPRDIIENEKNGLLVPVNNKMAMVDAIKKLLENPSKAVAISRNGFEIRKTYDLDRICECWYIYFNKILGKKQGY